jgi:hypothetical protein
MPKGYGSGVDQVFDSLDAGFFVPSPKSRALILALCDQTGVSVSDQARIRGILEGNGDAYGGDDV